MRIELGGVGGGDADVQRGAGGLRRADPGQHHGGGQYGAFHFGSPSPVADRLDPVLVVGIRHGGSGGGKAARTSLRGSRRRALARPLRADEEGGADRKRVV